jgi:hypothetical protein
MLRTCICHALLRPLTTSIINPPPRPNYGKFKPQSIYRSFYCMMLAPDINLRGECVGSPLVDGI